MTKVRSLEINNNRNSTNGVLQVDNSKIFYKILSMEDYKHEINGYKVISKFYKTPQKIFDFSYKNKGFVGYEYIENESLLLNYFIQNDKLDNRYLYVFDIYKQVFMQTISLRKPLNSILLFENRINTRLRKNFDYLIKSGYENTSIMYNGENIRINIIQIYKNITDFFKESRKKVCVVSQCDPNDLNICLDGTMFDFTSGGYVPLMAEFATFFWYNFGQAEYLSCKYNKQAFNKYNISRFKTKIEENNILYKPRRIRQDALDNYILLIDEVMNSYGNIHFKENWFNEFKNYLAMKVLAVFDFENMEIKDIKFSLAFISKVYNENYENIYDLRKIYK